MKRPLTLTLLSLSICACSGNSLIPSQQEEFQVDSIPVGASVLVLGEALGQTPMTIATRTVFPQNFESSKQHLYGRVELRYPGCQPMITAVSSRIISSGLKANLDCGTTSQQTAPAIQPSTVITQPKPLKLRLEKLKELYQEGLISESDYDEKRRQLLEEL